MTFLNLESITDQVRRLLQREIEGGTLTPGTRIKEEAFAKELGISKSPIRLALHQLKQDGIVRIEPRRGFYVAIPSSEQVLELMEMRELLDGLAARLAASRKDREFVAELEACFSGFTEETLAERRGEYLIADRRFQRLLIVASGSAELRRTLDVIILRLQLSRIYEEILACRDVTLSHRQHLKIIEAIKAGDAAAAESAAAAHVESVRHIVITNIVGKSSTSDDSTVRKEQVSESAPNDSIVRRMRNVQEGTSGSG